MRSLDRRLDKIERHHGGKRLVYAWREPHETADQVIERIFGKDADLDDVEIQLFSWAE